VSDVQHDTNRCSY